MQGAPPAQEQIKSRSVPLEVRGVSKLFGNTRALDDLSFRVEAGTCFTLLGPSGSGKTTILRLIAGFEEPNAGDIVINGDPVTGKPAYKRDIGVVFQHFALFPHMTVAQNIGYPLEVRRYPKRKRADLLEKVLDLVRLPGFESRYPSQLSGGQQQRVALARALVFEPQLLLMDEPLSALDKRLREMMQVEIRHLQKRLGITTITVTHDQTEAMVISDAIAILDSGRLQQIGPPLEVYQRPINRYVADFIGESNLLEGSAAVEDGHAVVFTSANGLTVRVEQDVSQVPKDRCCLVVRPEYITLGPDRLQIANRYAAEILEVIYLGDLIRFRVVLASGDELQAKTMANSGLGLLAVGAKVTVGWGLCDCLIVQR
jgi:spermidine/putrescine ABC transporter ATP-binding subunit